VSVKEARVKAKVAEPSCTMPTYYCYGCGAHIFSPDNPIYDSSDEEDGLVYADCCSFPEWVDYECKRRAVKNLNILKTKLWYNIFLLKEYKLAKERVKYTPGGVGFYEAFEEFEHIKNGKKRKPEESEELKTSKSQKMCLY